MNGLDLFSGIGGLTSALLPWVRPIAYCENDRYAQAVLLSRMADCSLPAAPIWHDVRTLRWDRDLPTIDIIYGGFPCQDISCAGNGAGLAGERSGLFFEIERLVSELEPSFVFLENVSAIRTRGADVVAGRLANLGYDCRWQTLSAADVGAPHRRKRWWLLAYSMRTRLQKSWREESKAEDLWRRSAAQRRVQDPFWLPTTGELRRVADGLSPATHRVKALGNAVVPQCAREAFMRLSGISSLYDY